MTRGYALSKLCEYCSNVKHCVMCRGEHERVVSGSYYLGVGGHPSGLRCGIKSEREMMYPSITERGRPDVDFPYCREIHAHCLYTMVNSFTYRATLLMPSSRYLPSLKVLYVRVKSRKAQQFQ